MKHFSGTLRRISTPRAIFIMFLAALIVPNVILSFTEPLSPAGMTVNILLPLGVYWLLMALSPNVGRTVWLFFPLVFLVAFQIVLLSLYGRSVIAVDMFLNLTTTNPGEAGELLANMWPTLLSVMALYLPLLGISVVMWRRGMTLKPDFLRRSRRHGMIVTMTGVGMLVVCVGADEAYSMRNDIFPLNVGYNISLAVDHSVRLGHYSDSSRGFSFDARSTRPDTLVETYVLVIGETSRADHWQINGYHRPTTPMLADEYASEIYNFPRAMSESNTTHKSVPLMLSHLTPATYGDSIYRVKSVITAFREAGFSTAFVSCQRRNGSFIDFFGAEADTCLFIREPDGLDRPDANDMTLARVFERLMADNRCRKRLIVLHTYGSHFSYRDRYPREYARFTPDTYAEAVAEKRSELINAYDNTIAMTDRLLDRILITLRRQPGVAAMIYTSDHGEDIFDDDRNLFLHASPCPSFYQLHVPFIVWLSPAYRGMCPQAASALQANSAKAVGTNSSYFNTAVDLAGIVTPRADVTLSVSSPKFRERRRCYLNDHNHCVSLGQSGFTEADLALLNALDGR